MSGTQKIRRVLPGLGYLDTAVMFLLAYAVYANTPVGAVGEWAVRKAFGKPTSRSLLSTFRSDDDEAAFTADAVEAPLGKIPPQVQAVAKKYALPPSLVLSFFQVKKGTCINDACRVPAPPGLKDALGKDHLPETVSLDTFGRGLFLLKKRTAGDPRLALEGLYVGAPQVMRAVEQADRSGALHTERLRSHMRFLPPALRRGPLDDVVKTLGQERLWTLAWPADDGFRVTSPFGYRQHPVLGKRKFHNGTDIGTPIGTPLYAAHVGTMKRVSQDSVSGKYIKIDHGYGIETTYCHLSEQAAEQGDEVEQKQVVARSGKTGRITGPHLHYIVRINGEPVDPESLGERALAMTKVNRQGLDE